MRKRYDAVGIGNAIVDVLGRVDDAFLEANGVEKGVMTLIDTRRAAALYDAMGPAREVSGGSAANTIAGLGMLGARAAYVGKVRDDQLGRIFAHDIRAIGVDFETPMAPAEGGEEETGRCLVLVTPDGERSMNTYLGVSAHLAPSDIDRDLVADAAWLFLEGYRFDGPDSQQAMRAAVRAARDAGGRVALTLSDPFCVERHLDAFRAMVRDDVDLLCANEAELRALYRTDDLERCMETAAGEVAQVACTVGPDGAWMLEGEGRTHVPAVPAERVDATGAGDLFAAGLLAGLAAGRDLVTAGRMGCVAAAEIIGHIGARPERDLRTLMRDAGF
ncbi:MAG TPA: adenosine kinase [Thermohalobaculum sp.]|nr:adenosine kinase [Thermohalobaculum sp.]